MLPEPARLGMRHAALRGLVAVSIGIALTRVLALPLWAVGFALVAALAAACFTRDLSLYLALAAAAFVYARAHLPVVAAPDVYQHSLFTAVVEDEPTRAGVSRYVLALQPPLRGRVTFWIPDAHMRLRYGDLIAVSSRIRPLDFPRNPGLTDFNEVLLRRRYVGSASARMGQVRVASRSHGLPWMRWLVMPTRRHVARVIDRHLPGAEGALLAGLLLGGSQGLPRDVRQAFTDAGVVHILAVSGMNVTIVVGVIWLLLSIVGIRGWWRFGLGVAGVVLYLSMVGWSGAPARAGVMACAVLLSFPLQRRVSVLASLCVAAMVLLLVDPLTLFDAGAQLSFAATAGIVLVAERLELPLSRMRGPRWLRSKVLMPLAASVAATVATAPLMLHHFFRVQPLSFVTTFAVAPLVGVIMPLGIVVMVADLISVSLAGIFANTLWLPLWLLLKLTLLMGRLDWAILQPGRVSWLWVGWAYLVMLLALGWRRRWARAGLALALVAGLNLAVWPSLFRKSQTRVVFLDPEEGDATLLEDSLGHRVLFDAGIDGPGVVRDYLRSRGIRYLDAVVVTHPDRDHFGGLLDLDERYRIGQLVVPVAGSPDTSFQRFMAMITARRIPVAEVGRGDSVKGTGFGIRFVWPDRASRAQFAQGHVPTNEVSLVAQVEYAGFKMLLTGDMDEPDAWLADSLHPDLLKAPHHGSRKGNRPTLYDALRPKYVVVMGRYPTPARLEERFSEADVDYFNTRRDGALTVLFREGRPVFEPYLRAGRLGVNFRPNEARCESPSRP